MPAPGLFSPAHLPSGRFCRVVSLVPSLTETLAGLGLADRLVGRTRFCTSSPEVLGRIPKIGGTKDPDAERIHALQPDLILAVKEENRPEDVLALAGRYPVLVLDIQTVRDVAETVVTLGRLLDVEQDRYQALNEEMLARLADIPPLPHPRCLYLIWQEPYMTVGADTYIASMMQACGLALPDPALTRYPAVDIEAFLLRHTVDAILLSSEPYPFREKHAQALQQATGVPTYCVDGQMFSWYGTLILPGLLYGRALRGRLLHR